MHESKTAEFKIKSIRQKAKNMRKSWFSHMGTHEISRKQDGKDIEEDYEDDDDSYLDGSVGSSYEADEIGFGEADNRAYKLLQKIANKVDNLETKFKKFSAPPPQPPPSDKHSSLKQRRRSVKKPDASKRGKARS